MQKQAPTLGRVMAMVLFALSCFGILPYLWVSFGGPTPLKPTGYRFEVQMPESALLVNEAPVRMAGLDVGKVKEKSLETQGGQTVVVEMNSDFSPIPSDSRVTLRQKSLLGQIYIEITPGSKDAPDPAEAITRITSTAGGAIGVVTAVLLLAFVVHRRRGN